MDMKDALKNDRAERRDAAKLAVEKYLLREKVIVELRKTKLAEPVIPWYRRKTLSPVQALAGMAAMALVAVISVSVLQMQRGSFGAPKDNLVPVEFTYNAPGAINVELAGDFAGWQTGKHRLQKGVDGVWRLKMQLPPGRYQYQFVIDGNWTADPQCPARVSDDFGRENSLLIL